MKGRFSMECFTAACVSHCTVLRAWIRVISASSTSFSASRNFWSSGSLDVYVCVGGHEFVSH